MMHTGAAHNMLLPWPLPLLLLKLSMVVGSDMALWPANLSFVTVHCRLP